MKKKIDTFFKTLPTFDSINQELSKSRTVYIKSPQTKALTDKKKLYGKI